MAGTFSSEAWQGPTAREAAALSRPLEAVREWLDLQAAGRPYRVVVVRGGRILAEWQQGVDAESRLSLASAAKSAFSCMLGIAIAEEKISSADARVVDYYPEMLDVPEGRGPKPGRFAKPQDREITFRQLISNTSGYMKPGEAPGSTFHYQTFGMNVLCHAIAEVYGLYDSANPERLPGLGRLVQEKIRDPIGGTWTHSYANFAHPPDSLTGIFGYYSQIEASARDLARLGLLWLHWGRWGQRQLVPETWLREAVRTAPDSAFRASSVKTRIPKTARKP